MKTAYKDKEICRACGSEFGNHTSKKHLFISYKNSFSLTDIVRATEDAKTYIKQIYERAETFRADPQRKERLAAQVCLRCFYMNHLSLKSVCLSCACRCGEGDVLCTNCANEQRACKRCGADVDLKRRRKL